MKKNNKRTTTVISIAVLSLLLMGTACSSNNANNAETSASPSVSASPSASSTPSASPSATQDVATDTGEYVGLQDNHTVEIITSEGPTAFQISPEIFEQVAEWDSGIPVEFQYTAVELDANGDIVKPMTIISIKQQ